MQLPLPHESVRDSPVMRMPERFPESLAIRPKGPVDGTIRVPGSKSLTNRALLCATLADGTSTLTGALQAEDTEVMIECLQRLGGSFVVHGDSVTVVGTGGRLPRTGGSYRCGSFRNHRSFPDCRSHAGGRALFHRWHPADAASPHW